MSKSRAPGRGTEPSCSGPVISVDQLGHMIIRAAKRKPAPEPEPEPEAHVVALSAAAYEDVKWHFAKYAQQPDDAPLPSKLTVAVTSGVGGAEPNSDDAEWRVRHRMKTVSVAIVVCLNVGVDPPDVIKTSPCARMECWIDPFSVSTAEKALDKIGRTLQLQYERWQPKATCKVNLDPTMEEVKKLALTMRRKAKDERVLFHYNGHGVPKPTANGEIWVFNKNYTQYIPLSVHDLLQWVGSPAIYVIDCSNAGQVLRAVEQAINRRNSGASPTASPTRENAAAAPPGQPAAAAPDAAAAPAKGAAAAAAEGDKAGAQAGQPAAAAAAAATAAGPAAAAAARAGGGNHVIDTAASPPRNQAAGGPPAGTPPPSPGGSNTGRSQEILLLAVCSATELLPMNPACNHTQAIPTHHRNMISRDTSLTGCW